MLFTNTSEGYGKINGNYFGPRSSNGKRKHRISTLAVMLPITRSKDTLCMQILLLTNDNLVQNSPHITKLANLLTRKDS